MNYNSRLIIRAMNNSDEFCNIVFNALSWYIKETGVWEKSKFCEQFAIILSDKEFNEFGDKIDKELKKYSEGEELFIVNNRLYRNNE